MTGDANCGGDLFLLFTNTYLLQIINAFFGLPAFLNSFGIKNSAGTLTIPANYQAGLTNIAYCGQMIGLLFNGWFQEKYGSRKAFIGGMILMTLTIFLAVFAVSLNMLLVAELAMGIPWGMFQTLSTAYAAEICPIQLRGYLNAFASIGYGGGAFISSGGSSSKQWDSEYREKWKKLIIKIVLKGTSGLSGPYGWKIPYILQWVWPVPLALGCCGSLFSPLS